MTILRPLRHRILAAVSLVALLICGVFSLYTVSFTYLVEDAYLVARLEAEASQLREIHASTGKWASPRDNRLSLHRSVETLPEVVRTRLEAEPKRVEFEAPGASHYHLLTMGQGRDSAWLLYDAGRDLIVPSMRNKLFLFLGISTITLVAIAMLVGYWAVRRATRQLEYLAANVAELDPDHMTASWAAAGGTDEVGLLAARLGEMTSRLRQFVERERSFTRDASHELRTPLAVIRAAGDQLYVQPELSQQSRQTSKLILESTARLESIIATLLALAREERSADFADLPLLPLIEQTVIDQAPRLEGKAVEVVVDVDPNARILAPEVVARIILANLVGNAFAHTAAGLIRIETSRGCLRITNPPAVDGELQQLGLPGGLPAADGYGFGLTIVRRLCAKFELGFTLSIDGKLVVATLPIAQNIFRS